MRLAAWLTGLALGLVGCAQRAHSVSSSSLGGSKQARARLSPTACTEPSDCMLLATDCCGDCGEPRRGHARAVNRAWASARGGLAQCAGVGCPRCRRDPDPTHFATCRAGRCAIADLARTPITRCTADTDCTLHHAGCCECGATDFVAIRADATERYEALVCSPEGTACPACEGPTPAHLRAVCASRRCTTERVRPGAPSADPLQPPTTSP